tara:strand:+ start:171 stop:425 length:255 start_codon:yes stop_codon:yes gene_type:complete
MDLIYIVLALIPVAFIIQYNNKGKNNLLLNILYSIIAILGLYYIITTIMDFLGIPIVFYSSYLMWFVALLILWAIIPKPENYFT